METKKQYEQLLRINEGTQRNRKTKTYKTTSYHMAHIKLVGEYALILNKRLHAKLNKDYLMKAALLHDVLKEYGLDNKLDGRVYCCGKLIPQDLVKYINNNLKFTETFGVSDFVGKIPNHSLAGAIWAHNELGIKTKQILYPMMFHSIPIAPVYETLSEKLQTYIDVIMLADKLSSNYLRIQLGVPVQTNLEKFIFGENGNEFNYTTGLYFARLFGASKSMRSFEKDSLKLYRDRIILDDKIIKSIIDMKTFKEKEIWPKEKSKVLGIR